MYSPSVPASAARALSIVRGNMGMPSSRSFGLRGISLVRSMLRLSFVGDAVDRAAQIVADVERSVLADRHAHRASADALVLAEPTSREIFDVIGPAVLEEDGYHFVSGLHRAVPGAVVGDEQRPAITRRKLRALVERDLQRRGVRLEIQRGRLRAHALGRILILGIGYAITVAGIAVGPAVVPTVHDLVHFVGRQVVADVIAPVDNGP